MRVGVKFLLMSVLFCSTAFGWSQEWTNTTGNGLWSTPGNWTEGQVPTWPDGWVGINAGSPGPTIDATIYDPYFGWTGKAWVGGLVIGSSGNGTGTVTMTGGTLYCGWTGGGNPDASFGGTVLGYGDGTNPNCNGVLNIEGGLYVNFHDILVGGHGGGNGTINMTGGELDVKRLIFGWNNVGADNMGVINLDAGLILMPVVAQTAGNGFVWADGENDVYKSYIDIKAGEIERIGDISAVVQDWVNQGKIIAYDGGGTVKWDYNVSNPGYTTIWATPEPSTMALLGLGSLLLQRRRKNR